MIKMESKKFQMRDEEFICENCGATVKRLNYTARDHCPYCLYSKHVDVNPGDRLSDCHGLLKPVGITKKKDKLQIVYICEKCKKSKRNIVAIDDNSEKIIELSVVK